MAYELIRFKPRKKVDAVPEIQQARCSSAADLQRILAADPLRILLFTKRKAEGFRREMPQSAANFLQMQRRSRAPRGFPPVSRLSLPAGSVPDQGRSPPAGHLP